jgi:predicted nucleic-acid-binding protein
MKKRLNTTVKEDLIRKMKKYADLQETSISSLVEEHFEELLRHPSKFLKEMSLVEFVKTLPKSKVDYPENFDFKKEYYKAKTEVY